MFKKICLSIGFVFLISVGLLFGGCWMIDAQDPVDVYLDYLDTESAADNEENAAEYVARKQQAAVVSVIATYNLRTDYASSYTQVYSGVIIDRDGYVLTTSSVAYFEYSTGHYIQPSTVYAVLSDVYDNDARYRLMYVDHDTQAGLAIYSFRDNFYHYADQAKQELVPGFQIWANFLMNGVSVGATCVAVGNAVGALNSNFGNANMITYVQQSVTQGIVSSIDAQQAVPDVSYAGKTFPLLLFSAPANENMYGGALFDENGYLIGLVRGQLTDGSASEICLERVSAALPASLLAVYIDSVSEQLQRVIPYTVVSSDAGSYTNTEAA